MIYGDGYGFIMNHTYISIIFIIIYIGSSFAMETIVSDVNAAGCIKSVLTPNVAEISNDCICYIKAMYYYAKHISKHQDIGSTNTRYCIDVSNKKRLYRWDCNIDSQSLIMMECNDAIISNPPLQLSIMDILKNAYEAIPWVTECRSCGLSDTT